MEAAGRASPQVGQDFTDLVSAHLGCAASSLPVISKDVVAHRFAWDVALEHLAAADPQARAVGVGGG